MDLSSTQQSPSIFSLNVPIDTPIEPISPSSQQSLFCQVLWFWSCFTKNFLYWGPYTIRFLKFTLIFELGAFGHASSIKKKKMIIIKNQDFPKVMHPFLNWGHSVMPHPFCRNQLFLKYQGFEKVMHQSAN